MTVERVEHGEGESVFSIYEPTRYGEIDVHRDIIVSHKLEDIAKLPRITSERLQDLPSNDFEMDCIETLPNGVKIVFLRYMDTDYYSNSYRHGSHSEAGPYCLVEKEPPEKP